MGDLNLKAASGGQIALTPTNTASNYTLTLPAVTGSVSVVSGTTGGITATNLLSSSTSVTGATTLTSSAFGVLQQCSGTSANYTVTLPAVSGNGGKVIGFQMATTLTKLVTIAGNAAETIDGSNTRIMWAGETAVLYCDGTAWTKIGGKTIPMVAGQTVSATQSIAASTAVKKTLGTALGANCPAAMNDTANSKIVIVRPAVYTCVYGFRLFNVSAGGSIEALLYVNGAEQGITFQYFPGSGYYPNANGVKNITFAVNDYIEDYCRQYTGATQTAGVANENALFVTEIPQW